MVSASLVALLAIAGAGFAPSARACENAVRYDASRWLRLVVRAEEQLRSGYPDRALRTLRPFVSRRRVDFELRTRAYTLASVAIVRLGGRVDRSRRPVASVGEDQRRAELERAQRWLASIEDSPRSRLWRAEAALALGTGVDAARATLIDLDTRGLLVDAHGLAALARLASDPTVAGRYRERCTRRAGAAASRICVARPALRS